MIRDHAWTARSSWRGRPGGEGTLQENSRTECGFFFLKPPTGPGRSHDLTYCNRPPEEHEWARGWVPGAVEPTPF